MHNIFIMHEKSQNERRYRTEGVHSTSARTASCVNAHGNLLRCSGCSKSSSSIYLLSQTDELCIMRSSISINFSHIDKNCVMPLEFGTRCNHHHGTTGSSKKKATSPSFHNER